MIRPATATDIGRILQMLERHYADKDARFKMDRDSIAIALRAAINAPTQLLLVGNDSFLFASFFFSPFAGGNVAAEHVVRCERPGEFDVLIAEYEKWAIDNGCKEAALGCTDRPKVFERIYGRRGYRVAETIFSKVLN